MRVIEHHITPAGTEQSVKIRASMAIEMLSTELL